MFPEITFSAERFEEGFAANRDGLQRYEFLVFAMAVALVPRSVWREVFDIYDYENHCFDEPFRQAADRTLEFHENTRAESTLQSSGETAD